MKFRAGDTVIVTAGKDKGKTGKIARVIPEKNEVIVEGMNMYARHVKPYGERAGEIVRRERALSTAKVAIVNEKGQPDRIGYTVSKDGKKERIFRKTGKPVSAAASKAKKSTKKSKK